METWSWVYMKKRPHVATEAWNHGLSWGNHPQMAARFRLIFWEIIPKWP
jgi:hypothetical protein